jgi:hypothetical protein
VKRRIFFISISTICIAALYWLLWGNIGLRLADEGLLWYNSVRTLHGDIPILDLQSYDPGRYYWNAFWMKLLGEGILGVRVAILIFQAMAFACTMLILRRVITSWWMLLILGAVIAAWMLPIHKAYDHSFSIFSVYAALLLIEKPVIKRYFVVGVFIGLSAVFGRNHGFYNLIIFAALTVYIYFTLNKTQTVAKLRAMVAGICLGYLPALIMLVVIPGYWEGAYVFIARYMLNMQGTNITLPIPWPWKVDYGHLPTVYKISGFIIGSLFLLIPIYYTCVAVWLLRSSIKVQLQPTRAITIATFFVGIVYIHYAFSRADIGHLALGIHPFLLSIMAIVMGICSRAVSHLFTLLILVVATTFSVGLYTPFYAMYSAAPGTWQEQQVQGDILWLDRDTATIINSATNLSRQLEPGETMLIAPHWPGLYAVTGQISPIWETYFLVNQLPDKQEEMIRNMKMKKVKYIIRGDVPLDGRDDLRFRNTHSLLYKYMEENYHPIDQKGFPANYQVLQEKP